MQRQNVTIRSRSPMGGKQTVHMKSKGGPIMGGPVVGSPVVGSPMMAYPGMGFGEVVEQTTMMPGMATGMVPPPLPAGYVETATYPAMMQPTMMAPTMGGMIPNNNRWKVTMKSKGNPGMGMALPNGTVAPYYTGNEGFTYKARQRSGGIFSRGPKSNVTIKERNRGANMIGGYYGGSSVMPYGTTTTVVSPPMVGTPPFAGAAMPAMGMGGVHGYQEEIIQQPGYAGNYTPPYIGG
jgi:hypothetical protein